MNRDITSLPFVADVGKRKRRCFWSVTASGDYERDCETGARYALEFLDYERQHGRGAGPCLVWVVGDMPTKHTGIEVGFLEMVGFAAAAGHETARRIVKYWERRKTEAQ